MRPRTPAGLVLVVEDDEDLANVFRLWLRKAGYESLAFSEAESCLEGLAELLPDAICLDLGLPGIGGLETLERVKARYLTLPVLILTADRNVETVVEAMRRGAYDYIVKPVDETKLVTTVRNAVERFRMTVRLAQLEREVEGRGYPGIVGTAPAMKELFRQMDRIGPADITVLVHGESGTGKELVARALHEASSRRSGPFVALNCAAIPESLQESELFGHEKGAFTNAAARRIGRFEQAHGGTLFLDEVAELSPQLQSKLLRAVQEKSFYRVGGSEEVRSDFRLLAATHRDLAERVKAGAFREDLYFRLAVFELEVPPLRERREDVPALVDHILASAGPPGGRRALSAEALGVLLAYPWPGNVRELENALLRAAAICHEGCITPHDLPPRVRRGAAAPPSGDEAAASAAPPPAEPAILDLERVERNAIAEALERTGGNLSEVVRQLRIGRTTLYRKMKLYGLKAP